MVSYRHRPYILFIVVLFISVGVRAQDAHFSQFYANPLYLNPAFAGAKVCPRVVMNYRNQWPAIPGSYVTYNASFDMHLDAIGGGFGVIVTSDRAGQGVLTTQTASLIYSARIRLSRTWFLKAGLQAGFFQKHLDWDKLTFGDQIDSKWGFSQTTAESRPPGGVYNKMDVDFSSGILVYNNRFFGGGSVHHMVPVNVAFTDNGESYMPMKITSHVGYMIPLVKGKRVRPSDPTVSPNLVYMQQGPFHQINYGAYFKKAPMIFGLWYRQFMEGSDAFIIQAGFEYDKFKFGYSYDITVSKLASASGGAHEFSFALDFNCPVARIRMHDITCPSF
jgi:type IX secretion system PorP/SprF family membrane protein